MKRDQVKRTVTRNPIPFDLDGRIKLLPLNVVESIRGDFYNLPGGTRDRWANLVRGNTNYMKSTEAEIFMNHIGCTISELHDPEFDLMDAYMRLKTEQESKLARHYGLVK